MIKKALQILNLIKFPGMTDAFKSISESDRTTNS